MKVGSQIAFFEGHTRTAPLNQLAAKRNKQRFNPSPFDVSQDRVDENFFQRASLSAVHSWIVSQLSIIYKIDIELSSQYQSQAICPVLLDFAVLRDQRVAIDNGLPDQ